MYYLAVVRDLDHPPFVLTRRSKSQILDIVRQGPGINVAVSSFMGRPVYLEAPRVEVFKALPVTDWRADESRKPDYIASLDDAGRALWSQVDPD